MRTKTITTANDERTILNIEEGILNVEIQRLAICSRLLRAVKHSNTLHSLGNRSKQMLNRERTIEVNGDHTNLLAVGVQVVDSLASCICSAAHEDDHAVSILCSVVREEVILATSNLRDLAEVLLNCFGNAVVVRIASFAMREEGLGILCSTASDGTLWTHSTVAETLDVLFLHEWTDVLLVHKFNLVILVRCAEAVEEVDERHHRLERCKVSYSGKIHYFLNGTFAKHSETSLAASHYVLMVAEDTQRVRSQRTSGNVEHTGNQLACNLVHIGNHQEQTLGSRECCSESTSLQGAMNGTCSTSLRLHFLNAYGLAPQVLATTSSPFVNMLRHRRRRSNGVDSSYL